MKLSNTVLLVLGITMLASSCKKDPEPIDSFVSEKTGIYTENECGNGGPITGSISLENAKLAIVKSGSETVEIICSHGVAGELFRCSATYESDSTLIVPAFQHGGKTYDGQYISRANGYIHLYLYLQGVECVSIGSKRGSIVWSTF